MVMAMGFFVVSVAAFCWSAAVVMLGMWGVASPWLV
jgi:hypothetical protein